MRVANLEWLGKKYERWYIENELEAIKVIKKLMSDTTVLFGLDLETARGVTKEDYPRPEVETKKKPVGPQPGLDPKLSSIRLLQLFDGKRMYVFDIWQVGINIFKELLRTKEFVAHNAVFELKHLINADCEPARIHCSMIAAMCVDRATKAQFEPDDDFAPDDDDVEEDGSPKKGNGDMDYRRLKGFSIEACVLRAWDVRVDKIFQVSNWNASKLSLEQINYAGLDALLTYQLFDIYYKEIVTCKMVKHYHLVREMQHVVAEMENEGFLLNLKKHKKLVNEWSKQYGYATERAGRIFSGVNLNSPKQLGQWIEANLPADVVRGWPRKEATEAAKAKDPRAIGAYTFAKTAIFGYAQSIEAVAALLECKKYSKLLNTYGEPLVRFVHPSTGRIHTSFSLGEVRTGRLSSRSPNLQNLPRSDDVREMFEAGSGRCFVLADFSQIELRVMGELSRDPTMLKAFREGIDLHKLVVHALMGVPLAKVTKEQRQFGKAVNFGLAFGMGPPKLRVYAKFSYDVDMTDDEAVGAWQLYHKKLYPYYSRWCTHQRQVVERLGFARTPLGKMRKLLPGEQYTRAVNTPVQGGAAEITCASTIILRKSIKATGLDASLVNCIHDEVIIETRTDNAPKVLTLLEDSMRKGMTIVLPKANLNGLVEAHVGKNWMEAKG